MCLQCSLPNTQAVLEMYVYHSVSLFLSAVPAFTNFSASPLSSSGSLLASWMVLTPGLHPLIQITVRWVELSAVEDIHDLSDPTSPAYPQTNIAVVEYSTKRQEVMQNDIISVSLEGGFTVNETYLVAITGTSTLGSKTTSFIFKVGMYYICKYCIVYQYNFFLS